MPGEHTGSARDEDEENGECTSNHGQRQQPAGDELPRGQGEQKEVQRLAKNRIKDAATTSGGAGVPKERERRPFHHHAGAGGNGNDQRKAECNEAQDRLNRQLHLLSADVNRVAARQVGEMRPLQSQERSIQNEKRDRCKSREDPPLQTQGFPEDIPVAERSEPEHIHVIRQRGPAAEDDAGKDGENEKEAAATARPRRMRRWPVNGLGHCYTPFSLTLLFIRMILPPPPQVASWLDPTAPLHGESIVVVNGAFTRRRELPRSRLAALLAIASGSRPSRRLSTKASAPKSTRRTTNVISSQACSARCSQNPSKLFS